MLKIKINDSEYQVETAGKKEGFQGSLNSKPFHLDLIKNKEQSFHIIKDHRSYNVDVLEQNGKEITLMVNNVLFKADVETRFDELLKQLGMDKALSGAVKELKAPMSGMVIDILVEEGQEVEKDDQLLILEAMKMENVLKAPADGKIKAVNINKGTAVEKNEILINFE